MTASPMLSTGETGWKTNIHSLNQKPSGTASSCRSCKIITSHRTLIPSENSFHQVRIMAEKTLTLVEASQISLGWGNTGMGWLIESKHLWGVSGEGKTSDTYQIRCIPSLHFVKKVYSSLFYRNTSFSIYLFILPIIKGGGTFCSSYRKWVP